MYNECEVTVGRRSGEVQRGELAWGLRAGPAVVVLAPLILVGGRVLGVGVEDPFADPTSSGRFLASELVSFAATVLFLPAALFLAWVLRGSESRAGAVGAALVAVGVVGSAGIYALDFASVELSRAGPRQDMRSIFIAMLESPGVQVLRSLEVGLPLGLVLLGWALWSRRVVRWEAALGITVAVFLSNDNIPDPVAVLGATLLLVGFAAAALPLLRKTSGPSTS
jgi:hypothetical protein